MVASAARLGSLRRERVSEDLEAACIDLAGSATENVDSRADAHVQEADVLEHCLPARARQATCNSTGPEIDLPHCGDRDGTPVGYVGEL